MVVESRSVLRSAKNARGLERDIFPAATAPFPKSCTSYFRFARFYTFPIYYLRAWHLGVGRTRTEGRKTSSHMAQYQKKSTKAKRAAICSQGNSILLLMILVTFLWRLLTKQFHDLLFSDLAATIFFKKQHMRLGYSSSKIASHCISFLAQ